MRNLSAFLIHKQINKNIGHSIKNLRNAVKSAKIIRFLNPQTIQQNQKPGSVSQKQSNFLCLGFRSYLGFFKISEPSWSNTKVGLVNMLGLLNLFSLVNLFYLVILFILVESFWFIFLNTLFVLCLF